MAESELTQTLSLIGLTAQVLVLLAVVAFTVVAAIRVGGMAKLLIAGAGVLMGIEIIGRYLAQALIAWVGALDIETMLLAQSGVGFLFSLLFAVALLLAAAGLWQWPRPAAEPEAGTSFGP
ncbi:MAG: hypothetical protein ACFCGT_18265 [Sandaracinaceae bacterium]